MESPQITENHAVFKKFVGSWQGEEIISPSEWTTDGAVAIGRIRNQIALGGFVLIQDLAQSGDGEVVFRAHNLIRFDESEGHYVLHWFDSVGFPPNELHGQYENDVLTFTGRDPVGYSRLVYDCSQPDSYSFQMFASADGESWQIIIDALYHRE